MGLVRVSGVNVEIPAFGCSGSNFRIGRTVFGG